MRFEAGTLPIVVTVIAAALDYLDGVGRERSAAHEMALARAATRRLKELNGIRTSARRGIRDRLSPSRRRHHAHDLATILDREGVAVRGGHHCPTLMERFNVAERPASFALYNTLEK
jgi:cysteine desulfurase/selenocysteine lyase